MDSWIILAGAAVLVAVAVPLVKTLAGRKAGSVAPEERRSRQRQVVEDLDRVLAPLTVVGPSSPVRIGPGSPLYDEYIVVRRRMRDEFRSGTGMRFDREFGYSLNRPGTMVPGTSDVLDQIRRSREVLLSEIQE